MLVIHYRFPDASRDICLPWHLAQASPRIEDGVRHVDEVLVTGDELLAIKEVFKNLPYPSSWVREEGVRWFGDHARFIVGNLPILARWQK